MLGSALTIVLCVAVFLCVGSVMYGKNASTASTKPAVKAGSSATKEKTEGCADNIDKLISVLNEYNRVRKA